MGNLTRLGESDPVISDGDWNAIEPGYFETLRVPHVPEEERVSCDDLGYSDDGISHVSVRIGFQDDPNVPALLRLAAEEGLERQVDLENPSYYLSQITIVPTEKPALIN